MYFFLVETEDFFESHTVLFVCWDSIDSHTVSYILIIEYHAEVDFCLCITYRFEGDDGMKVRIGKMLEFYTFIFYELSEDIGIRVVGTIGSMHDEFPCTSFSEFESLECIGKSMWSPPLREEFRISIGFPEVCGSRMEYVSREDVSRVVRHFLVL